MTFRIPLFRGIIRKEKWNILLLLGVAFGVILIACSVRGNDASIRSYDIIRSTGDRNEVIIVGIDDKSLQALGAWPWDRETFADLTRVFDEAGTKLIAYDILFLEPRTGDEDFAEALAESSTRTFLASKRENGAYLSSHLARGSTTIVSAIANVEPNSDGKVRLFPTAYSTNGECVSPLAYAAFAVYAFKDQLNCTEIEKAYFRYPSTITTYSLVDVLKREVPLESFRGKVVFIGSNSVDLEDHFVGMGGGKIPGVFVHASVFTSLLNNERDILLSNAVSACILLLLSLLSALCVYIFRSTYAQTGAIVFLIVMTILVSVISFSLGLMIPLPWLLVTIVISASLVALMRFISEKSENQYIQSLFSKYVHRDVLRQIMDAGNTLTLGGERKTITVLFSDLRGFTTLSESMSPEELTSTLNKYLSAMTPEILNEKGTIDKFIGDAIMAFWNAPLDVDQHHYRAVKSALHMERALKMFNEKEGTSLAIGIGVHSGFAVVGNVGGVDRVNYTALGDTVNLASRIESLTKKYGVGLIVTKTVRDAIDDDSIAFRCLDVITVVGKTTPTTLYEVRFADDFAKGLVSAYEKAFKLYYEGKWEKAEKAFEKLAKEGDKPSEKMLERIPVARAKEHWDGIWRFDEK